MTPCPWLNGWSLLVSCNLQLTNVPCERCNTITELQTFVHHRDAVVLRCPFWRCRHYMTVRRHSFFEGTHIPLTKQMHLLILFCADSTMSSSARATHLSHPTVIQFFDRCCELCRDDLINDPIQFTDGGEYEVDECIIQRVYIPAANTISPIWIQGILERDTGLLALYRVPDRTMNSLCTPVETSVPDGSLVYTDELSSYNRLHSATSTHEHHRVNHSSGEYARIDTLSDGSTVNVKSSY